MKNKDDRGSMYLTSKFKLYKILENVSSRKNFKQIYFWIYHMNENYKLLLKIPFF